MSGRFQIVYYVPDPFTEGRVPVAAIVSDHHGVRIATAAALPGPACVGGHAGWTVLQAILDELGAVKRFGELPSSIGPQAVLGPARVVPVGVEDLAVWVREHVLPQPQEHAPRMKRNWTQCSSSWRIGRRTRMSRPS